MQVVLREGLKSIRLQSARVQLPVDLRDLHNDLHTYTERRIG